MAPKDPPSSNDNSSNNNNNNNPTEEHVDENMPQLTRAQPTTELSRIKELGLLPIRRRVLLPGGLLRLTIGRPKSVRLVDSLWDSTNRTFKKGAMIAITGVVVAGNDEGGGGKQEEEEAVPTANEALKISPKDPSLKRLTLSGGTVVYEIGTAAKILQLSRVQGKEKDSPTTWSMLVEGIARVRCLGLKVEEPFYVSKIEWPATIMKPGEDAECRALAMNVKSTSKNLLETLRKRTSGAIGSRMKEVLETVDKATPEHLADVLTSSNGDATMREKQAVLGELNLAARLRKALELVNRQVEVLQLSEKIQSQVEGKLKNSQREYYLRQQLKAINDELNSMGSGGAGAGKDGEGGVDEIAQLENTLKAATLPQEARVAADREMSRLKNMQPNQPEYTVVRTYLEWMSELPWGKSTVDNLDVNNAQKQLDDDHFGLDKVKKRMVEFLAVRSLKRDSHGPILCLVGPPGVGKTSLGRSIATALGRKFRRLALGGVRDEAEIRGHRRTYIGALPGNIIQSLKKAGSDNPVILLDEIDKLGRDIRGDPGSALLEVLDPEQNSTFTDHYLNVPFDLSKILFIATANDVSTIPPPLLDRMELIEVPGYSLHEKVQIALRHLVPKQMERHGITEEHLKFTDEGIITILEGYTREAGVRQLDREIAGVCRGVAVKVAEARDRYLVNAAQEEDNVEVPEAIQNPNRTTATNHSVKGNTNTLPNNNTATTAPAASGTGTTTNTNSNASPGQSNVAANGTAAATTSSSSSNSTDPNAQPKEKIPPKPLLLLGFEPVILTKDNVKDFLGPHRFENEVASRTAVPGVATGMAWTQVGGAILFIEVSLSRGTGRIQITGRLGETMKESVAYALSYVRAHAVELGLNTHRDQFGEDIDRALRHADIHVHFPEGATPKDGPSAGVAITAALVSALSGHCVRSDTACTGEVTLRGLVLPVGGVKEKVMAAHRAGIKRVVIPTRNEKDTLEIPKAVRDELQIILVSNIPEAMGALFDPDVKFNPPAWRIRLQQIMDEERKRSSSGHFGSKNSRNGNGRRLNNNSSNDGTSSGDEDEAESATTSTGEDFSGPVLVSKM
jgi:endopeptidase La